ncbi:dihydroorotate dehydrogenase [Candidatus Omnitrophota bacterium]
MKLGVKIGRLSLKNPVMVASGTFGYAKEFEGLVDLKKLGAIVTKTITLEARPGNPMPRTCETPSGMLNSIGLQNDGIENFINEKLPYLARLGVPVVVSISGDSAREFCELAKRLDNTKSVHGIELNISCPNIIGRKRGKTGRGLIAQDKDATYKVVKGVRKKTQKTLITKLSPNVTDIVEMAQVACKAGTDAVSLVNTFFGMAIDIESRKPILASVKGGLSGPCIKPIALRMVWEVAKNIKKPVIGIGGIMDTKDAIEFLLAGAKAVQIGTANFIEPNVCSKIIKGIEVYLKKNRIENIKNIIKGL